MNHYVATILAAVIFLVCTGVGAGVVHEDISERRVTVFTWAFAAATLMTLALSAALGYALFIQLDGI